MDDCCKKKPKAFKEGVINGLIPHIGCIAFIVFAAIGATTAASFVKPLLLSSALFYVLIAVSILFSGISAVFYLKRNKHLNLAGIKNSRKYLSVLFGTTISVNLLFFFVIFPYTANAFSGNAVISADSQLTVQVNIPCSGHAPLIISEVRKADGISNVRYRFPDLFDIQYDSSRTTKEEIANLNIFQSFRANIRD